MDQSELFKALISGIPAATVALVSAILVLLVTQGRQDRREVASDERKLRDDKRERLRNAETSALEHAWEVRRFIAKNAHGNPVTSEQRQRFLLELEELEDRKNKVAALISVDANNLAIAEANFAYSEILRKFVAAYLSGGDKWPDRAIEYSQSSRLAIEQLIRAIQEEIGGLSQPVKFPSLFWPQSPDADEWLIDKEEQTK